MKMSLYISNNISILDNSEIYKVFVASILSDNGHHSLKAWKGEILDQAIEVRVSANKKKYIQTLHV